jgi:cation diffusion facilitator CzcD-associated flavoprotein CzcO
MSKPLQVAIIGAGPYGLSVAAYLRERGIGFRIFGKPLHSWRAQMPKGMFLKSEGFASNLHDPQGAFTLGKFCAERGLPYADTDQPVPLDAFTAYGTAFQQKFVPDLEDEMVVALEKTPEGFRLSLANGETLDARHVVVAVGLSDFRQIPRELATLPASVLSHSADHHDLGAFWGRDVTVIGGGSSALDLVASLRAAGAQPRLVARRGALRWNMPANGHHLVLQVLPAGAGRVRGRHWRIRYAYHEARPARRPWRWYPISGLGGGWRNVFFEHAPMVFRHLPQETRLQIVRRWLGPSGGWPARKSVEQSAVMLGQRLRTADWRGGRVELYLVDPDSRESTVETDHVIAATGYKVDLRRLTFMDARLGARVRTIENTPVLSSNFESSVAGLYFVGLASANTFGPVMRFLLGARYTARRISQHVTG